MKEILLYTDDMEQAEAEIKGHGAQVAHRLTSRVLVARFQNYFDHTALKHSSPQPASPLDRVSKLAAGAWQAYKSQVRAPTPQVAPDWDAPGRQHPKNPQNDSALKRLEDDAKSKGTAAVGLGDYMVGSVGIGVVIVSGAQSQYAISEAEHSKILQQVYSGTAELISLAPTTNLSFVYDLHFLTVDVTPCSGSSSYEACEAPWRNAALAQLGYDPSILGNTQYVTALRDTILKTNWAYAAYFTKYPLYHFAYEWSSHTVMSYDNDGWGPDQIGRVFAHESCHIFQALDEYGNSDCRCDQTSGVLNAPNRNCVNCPSPSVSCLMKSNSDYICQYSRGQVGWHYWNWGQDINNSALTDNSPALAEFGGKLFMAWRSNNGTNNIYTSATSDPLGTWPQGASIGKKVYATNRPALFGFAGSLYLIWGDVYADELLTIASSSDGQNWSSSHRLDNQMASSYAPAIAQFGTSAVMVWASKYADNYLYVSSSQNPGGGWSDAKLLNLKVKSDSAPSLTVFNGKLYLAWTNPQSANQVYLASSADGVTWQNLGAIGVISSSGPSINVWKNQLRLLYTDGDQIMELHSLDGQHWDPATSIGKLNTTSTEPYLGLYADNLFVGFKPDYSTYLKISKRNTGKDD